MIYFLGVVIIALLSHVNCESTLRMKILESYDQYTRPVSSYTTPTNVGVGISVIRANLNEEGILDLYSLLQLQWQDDYLHWNPNSFGGQSSLSMPSDQVWRPDIALYNSGEVQEEDSLGGTNVIVNSTGGVLWVPPFSSHTYCNVDLALWPFDTQTCTVKLGSWTRSTKEIVLSQFPRDLEMEETLTYFEPGDWDIIDISVKITSTVYPCCPDMKFDDITYTLELRRIAVFDKIIVKILALVACTIVLLSFWIQPNALTNKLVLLSTDILMTVIVLLAIRQLVQCGGQNIPHVVIFYSVTLFLEIGAVFIAMYTAKIASRKTSVPRGWTTLLSGVIGKLLCLQQQQPVKTQNYVTVEGKTNVNGLTILADEELAKASSGEMKNPTSWILVATTINRIIYHVNAISMIIMYALLVM